MRKSPLSLKKVKILWSTQLFLLLGKIHNIGQFAGNFSKEDTSETTRETLLADISANNIIINEKSQNDFLYWLIGFTEGDGSFIVSKKGYCEFKLTQSSIDVQILYKVQNLLGLGYVGIQDKKNKTHHLRIRDKIGNKRIIDIFNGNLHTKAKIIQFKYFLDSYNKAYGTDIKYIENNKPITLDNAWLTGFTDAEGCFNAYISKEKPNIKTRIVQIRYILSQKGDKELMDNIAKLLGGSVSHIKSYNGYNMTVNLSKLKSTIEYFNTYPLLTKKINSYNIWLDMYKITLNKEHLTSKGLNKVLELKENLTKANKV